jgi:hypothetical protein
MSFLLLISVFTSILSIIIFDFVIMGMVRVLGVFLVFISSNKMNSNINKKL